MSAPLEIASATHAGMVREHNEDCIAADAQTGIAVLADGMGGHNAGEVASRMAVELIYSQLKAHRARAPRIDRVDSEALVAQQIDDANSAVFEAARADAGCEGMGTTLVVALYYGSSLTVGHVGDSRLYRLRAGALEQLTRDHSVVQEQLELGTISQDELRYAANRNVLTRAVGIDPAVSADVHTLRIQAGDVYLLCSDGLTDMLSDREIQAVLVSSDARLESVADQLVQRANEKGGIDNISVILVRAARGSEELRR